MGINEKDVFKSILKVPQLKEQLENHIQNHPSGGDSGEIDMSNYQTKVDNSLTTNSKNIVGAINEANTILKDKVSKTEPLLETTSKDVITAINELYNMNMKISTQPKLANLPIKDKLSSEYNIDFNFTPSFTKYSDNYYCSMFVRNNILYFEAVIKRVNTDSSVIIDNLPFEIRNFKVNTFIGQVCNKDFTTCKPILIVTHPKEGKFKLMLEFDSANISGATEVDGCYYLPVCGFVPIRYNEGSIVSYENVDRIKSLNGSKFVVFTDGHMNTSNDSENIGSLRKIRAVNKCNEDINANFAISLGDIVDDWSTGNKDSQLNAMRSVRRALLPNTIFAQGNHCVNGRNDDKTVANVCTPKDLFKTLTFGKTGLAYTNNGQNENYYLYDDNVNKVRYIVLNTHDVPTDKTGNEYKYNLFNTYAFRQNQIDWLIRSLNTSYDVVLYSHVGLLTPTELPDDNTGYVKNSNLVREILKAFNLKTKGSVTSTDGDFTINSNYDFTSINEGKVIASIFGHYHYDVNYLDGDGIRHIGMEDLYGSDQYTVTKPYCKDYTGRVPNSDSDCSFRVVNIDTSAKTVTMLPIGVGQEIIFNY